MRGVNTTPKYTDKESEFDQVGRYNPHTKKWRESLGIRRASCHKTGVKHRNNERNFDNANVARAANRLSDREMLSLAVEVNKDTRHTNLTFRGPHIVIYSYNERQRDALYLTFI